MEHTIFGLIKRRGEIAGQHKFAMKAADVLKVNMSTIDRSLVLCCYQNRPKSRAPCGKCKQLFGRNELTFCILDTLRVAPADDEAIAKRIIERKGWDVDTRYGLMC
jgi:cytidine deaminase